MACLALAALFAVGVGATGSTDVVVTSQCTVLDPEGVNIVYELRKSDESPWEADDNPYKYLQLYSSGCSHGQITDAMFEGCVVHSQGVYHNENAFCGSSPSGIDPFRLRLDTELSGACVGNTVLTINATIPEATSCFDYGHYLQVTNQNSCTSERASLDMPVCMQGACSADAECGPCPEGCTASCVVDDNSVGGAVGTCSCESSQEGGGECEPPENWDSDMEDGEDPENPDDNWYWTNMCESSADCDDTSPLTDDVCISQMCFYIPIPNACNDDSDCDKQGACNLGMCMQIDGLDAGRCQYRSNSLCCDDAAGISCDDGNPCTVDSCGQDNLCDFVPVDCSDGDVCTNDYCDASGACVNEVDPFCCDTHADCPSLSQSNECARMDCVGATQDAPGRCVPVLDSGLCDSSDSCILDVCEASEGAQDGSGTCATYDTCNDAECTNSPCEDSDVCTIEICEAGGVCNFVTLPGCCTLDAHCDDSLGCTVDRCIENSCQHHTVGDCCTTDAHCDDGLSYTADTCNTASGVCGHTLEEGFCEVSGDCPPDTACTVWSCNAQNVCESAPRPGTSANCCDSDADCSDPNGLRDCVTSTCVNNSCRMQAVDVPGVLPCATGPDNCVPDDWCTISAYFFGEDAAYGVCLSAEFLNEDQFNIPAQGSYLSNNGSLVEINTFFPYGFIGYVNSELDRDIYIRSVNMPPGTDPLILNGECCIDDTSCDDGDVCTNDECRFFAQEDLFGFTTFRRCFHTLQYQGCCNEDADCDDANACTLDYCDDSNRCRHQDISETECPQPSEGCAVNVCNPDYDASTDPASAKCSLEAGDCPAVGCAVSECVVDEQDPEASVCVDTPIDCDDSNPCTVDACVYDEATEVSFCTNTKADVPASIESGLCTPAKCFAAEPDPLLDYPQGTANLLNANTTVVDGAYWVTYDRDCSQASACFDGVCDAETGECAITFACESQDPCVIPHCGSDIEGNDVCVFTAVNCNDGNPCTEDACNSETGMCESVSVGPCPNDVVAQELGAWSVAQGNCTTVAPVCDDWDKCTTDSLVEVTESGFTCNTTSVENCCNTDADCLSSLGTQLLQPWCTTANTCSSTQIAGACSLDNDCTGTNCDISGGDPVGRCNSTIPAGAHCAHDYDCYLSAGAFDLSVTLQCTEGECVSPARTCDAPLDLCSNAFNDGASVGCDYSARDCDDSDPCTIDTCDPSSGCVHTPRSACCCAESSECDDGMPCTVDVCDASNQCTYESVPEMGCCSSDAQCDDHSVCTTDTCDPETGNCSHTPVICDDVDPCTEDMCDPVEGCIHIYNPPPCDDDLPCTTDTIVRNYEQDTCECVIEPLDVSDSVMCTTDVCNPAATTQDECVNVITGFTVGDMPSGDSVSQTYACLEEGVWVSASAQRYQNALIRHISSTGFDRSTCFAGACDLSIGTLASLNYGECDCDDSERCTQDTRVLTGYDNVVIANPATYEDLPFEANITVVATVPVYECVHRIVPDCCPDGPVMDDLTGTVVSPGRCLYDHDPCLECKCLPSGDCECDRIPDCCEQDPSCQDPELECESCDDSNVCTRDFCMMGWCINEREDPLQGPAVFDTQTGDIMLPGCCTTDEECRLASGVHDNPCYGAFCQAGMCMIHAIPGCCLEESPDAPPYVFGMNSPDPEAPIDEDTGLPLLGCDDGDVCTEDLCGADPSFPNKCTNTEIEGCCVDDNECPDDSDPCTVVFCNQETNVCDVEAVPDCCVSDDECSDSDPCTDDTCDLQTNTCVNTPNADCCIDNTDCCVREDTLEACFLAGAGSLNNTVVESECVFGPCDVEGFVEAPACFYTQCMRMDLAPQRDAFVFPGGMCQALPIQFCCEGEIDDEACADARLGSCRRCDVEEGAGVCEDFVEGCCLVQEDCDDSNECTDDECVPCEDPEGCLVDEILYFEGEQYCVNTPKPFCCVDDDDCNPGFECCTNFEAPICLPFGTCEPPPAPGCRLDCLNQPDAPPEDLDPCTYTHCAFDENREEFCIYNDPIEDCCASPGDCDDSLACTDDICKDFGANLVVGLFGIPPRTVLYPYNQCEHHRNTNTEDVDACWQCTGLAEEDTNSCNYCFQPVLVNNTYNYDTCTCNATFVFEPCSQALEFLNLTHVDVEYDTALWPHPPGDPEYPKGLPSAFVYIEPAELVVSNLDDVLPEQLLFDGSTTLTVEWLCSDPSQLIPDPAITYEECAEEEIADQHFLTVVYADKYSAQLYTECENDGPCGWTASTSSFDGSARNRGTLVEAAH